MTLFYLISKASTSLKNVFCLQDAFLAGQHFAKHYPDSMTRLDRIKVESKKSNEELKTGKNSSKLNNCGNTCNASNNKIKKMKVENGHITEEKAAADLFPLNLISNRFKSADMESSKGKPCIFRVVTLGFQFLPIIHSLLRFSIPI